jgi:hypothetical protein
MNGQKMAKWSLWFTTAVVLVAALLLSCGQGSANENRSGSELDTNGKEVIVDGFSLTVTLDKTEARIGDTVTATVVFKNLSGKDIEAELPDWIAAGGFRSKEDILTATFIPEGTDLAFEDILFEPRPKILIESGAVIERKFEYAITASGNLEVHAGAFFIAAAYPANSYGVQIVSGPIKILVQ